MSDNEDYSDSDSESSSISEQPIAKKINIDPNKVNFTTYENDDSDLEEVSENESEESDVESLVGGADSELEEGEIDEGDDDESEKAEDDEENEDKENNEFGDEEEQSGKKTSAKQVKPKKKIPVVLQDDDDEDDEYDENYLQKFDSEISKNYIVDFHPECLNHNYEEVAKLSTVVRNSDNIIVDPLHRTIPFLTKYEKARILGQRAKQIETGAKPLVKLPENIIDSYVIAELELKEKKIPFIIKRPIPSGGFEYWNLKDLEMIGY